MANCFKASLHYLPAGIWNSVMSVSHSSFGAAALKSRCRRLSGAGLISPMWEPYRRRLGVAATKHSCFISRCTTFSESLTGLGVHAAALDADL